LHTSLVTWSLRSHTAYKFEPYCFSHPVVLCICIEIGHVNFSFTAPHQTLFLDLLNSQCVGAVVFRFKRFTYKVTSLPTANKPHRTFLPSNKQLQQLPQPTTRPLTATTPKLSTLKQATWTIFPTHNAVFDMGSVQSTEAAPPVVASKSMLPTQSTDSIPSSRSVPFPLPAELRIRIYKEALLDAGESRNSTFATENYRGVIFASHQLRDEFLLEWKKATNSTIDVIHAAWPFKECPLLISPIEKLDADTTLHIHLPETILQKLLPWLPCTTLTYSKFLACLFHRVPHALIHPLGCDLPYLQWCILKHASSVLTSAIPRDMERVAEPSVMSVCDFTTNKMEFITISSSQFHSLRQHYQSMLSDRAIVLGGWSDVSHGEAGSM
ncbi:hypothetical protein CC80DRAFT_585076, partial [Byssothecium circinans]